MVANNNIMISRTHFAFASLCCLVLIGRRSKNSEEMGEGLPISDSLRQLDNGKKMHEIAA